MLRVESTGGGKMSISRGKRFEKEVQGFLQEAGYSVIRLYDTMMGYAGVSNPCDFVAYKKPNIIYMECKSTYNGILNFKSDIRESQWEGLTKRKDVDGAVCGFLVWFVSLDKTLFVPIQTMLELREQGYKSLDTQAVKNFPHFEVEGKRTKIYFKYDVERFNLKMDLLRDEIWQKYHSKK